MRLVITTPATFGRLCPQKDYEIGMELNCLQVGSTRCLKIEHISGKSIGARYTNKDGAHRQLIDLGTFNQVQSVMAGHNLHATRKRKHSWLLSGFIYCATHAKRYTAEWHLNKKIAYYHCTNREGCSKYIETNKLKAQIAERFKEIQFSPDFIEAVISSVQKAFYQRNNDYESKRQGLVNRRKALEAKRKVAEESVLRNAHRCFLHADTKRDKKENRFTPKSDFRFGG